MPTERARILIVDDESIHRDLVTAYVERMGHQVVVARNGKDALAAVSKRTFDLVLLDIQMPDLSGFEVCEKIRQMEMNREVPIIFLSALKQKDSVLSGFERGAQDYLVKPCDPGELKARINTQLELQAARRKLKEMNRWLEEKVIERTRQLKEANDELMRLNRALVDLDEVKTEFLRIISHEIRTPLNGIMAPMEMLARELRESELSELMDVLDESVSRLEKFSLAALTITKLRTPGFRIRHDTFDFRALIAFLESHLSGHAVEKNINFEVVDEIINPLVAGDKDLIVTGLENILNNAIKYSPEGGKIMILLKQERMKVTCEIVDQGKGFSEKALKNLFKLFVPGEGHIDSNIGIGLALSKLIVDAHGGTLEAYNREGGGAVVRMTLKSA